MKLVKLFKENHCVHSLADEVNRFITNTKGINVISAQYTYVPRGFSRILLFYEIVKTKEPVKEELTTADLYRLYSIIKDTKRGYLPSDVEIEVDDRIHDKLLKLIS